MKEFDKVMEAALRLLDFQDRTVSELREKLNRKGFDEEISESVIESLSDSGILDDRRYARLFISARLGNGKGRNWIRNRLVSKGIDRSVIQEELESASEETDERILCIRRALSICSLGDRFEVDDDGEIFPVHDCCGFFNDGGNMDSMQPDGCGNIRYFYRKIPEGETDRGVIYREHEKAKASLVRRLVSAGYPSGMAFEAVKKIDRL